MVLVRYTIQHPSCKNHGAQYVSVPAIVDNNEIKKVIEDCIGLAKEVAKERGFLYEEMIHTLNGNIIDPNKPLLLQEQKTEPIKPHIKRGDNSYTYQSKTCAY